MKIEVKEHELERIIEVYFQLQFKKNVVVNGFDLSGMRSKDGLSAMVDITIVGETDLREPKLESSNVKPTNTSWRDNTQESDESAKEDKYADMSEEDVAYWAKFLHLIVDNAGDKNADNIYGLLEEVRPAVAEMIKSHELFIEMDERLKAKAITGTTDEMPELDTEEPVHIEPVESEAKPVKPALNMWGQPINQVKPNADKETKPATPTRRLFPSK